MGFLCGSDGKESAYNEGDWFQSLGREDPLVKGIATHSSILAWRISWTEDPWDLDHKEGWVMKNWCFQTWVLEKALESPLDSKEIKPVNPKGNQPWIFIRGTHAEADVPILWPPDGNSRQWKRPWCWERLKSKREEGGRGWDGWTASLPQQTWVWAILGVSEGQGGLVCCRPWGHKGSDTLSDRRSTVCWYDTFIYCNTITTIRLANTSIKSHNCHFFLVVRTFDILSPGYWFKVEFMYDVKESSKTRDHLSEICEAKQTELWILLKYKSFIMEEQKD